MKFKISLLLLPLLALACSLTANVAQIPITTHEAMKPAQVPTTAQTSTPGSITCTVTAKETLNLRAMPGTSATVIAVLKHDDLLTILPDPAQDGWIRVQTPEGEGWINSNYCERTN